MRTPGPWKTGEENCGDGLNIYSDLGHRIAHTAAVRNKRGELIAPEEAKANARLIAEAPQLLADLVALTDWAREHTSPLDANTPHTILVRAVETIKKATQP